MNRIDADSPRGRLAAALLRLLATEDGKTVRSFLESDVLGPLSSVDPATGAIVSHDQMMLAEGQKLLAKKLLASADEDARLLKEA